LSWLDNLHHIPQGLFYDIGFSGLLVAYALEVLPFHLRAKGMMVMNITVIFFVPESDELY
jgi:hypothetical protein